MKKKKQKTKTIEEQGKKQIKALEEHGKQLAKYSDEKESSTHSNQTKIFEELANRKMGEIRGLNKKLILII